MGFKRRNEGKSSEAIARRFYQAINYYPGTHCFLSEVEFVEQLGGFFVGDMGFLCLECFDGLHHPDDRREFVELVLLLSYCEKPDGVVSCSKDAFFGHVVLVGYFYIGCIGDVHPMQLNPVMLGFAHACLRVEPITKSRVYGLAYAEQVGFLESHPLPIATLVNRP